MSTVDLVKDIKGFFKDDCVSEIKIEISSDKIGVHVNNDSFLGGYINYSIYYDLTEKAAFLEQSHSQEHPTWALTLFDIQTIKTIMEYLDKNKESLNELCEGLSWTNRTK